MKKILMVLALGSAALFKAQTVPNFTIVNSTGSSSITCTNPGISLMANTNYTASALTYSWVSANATLSGSSVIINTPGIYTVTAYASASLSVQHTVAIGINTIAPTAFVAPNSQSIVCMGSAQAVSVVASPSLNVQHNITSPYGGAFTVNSFTAVYSPFAPGTYTDNIINTINGCSVAATFTLNGTGFPSINITSPQNFVLGCNTNSLASIIATNTQTGSLTYTITSPTLINYTTIPMPSASVTSTLPGIWTITAMDNSTGCSIKVPVTVTQNTVGPDISATVLTRTLSCSTPSAILQGASTTSNVSYKWESPANPNGIAGSNFTVLPGANASSSLIANYTLVVTNNVNSCSSTSVISMYQNLYAPIAKISNGIAGTLTCSSPSITLVNTSQTGIPPNTFFTAQAIIGLLWQGPAPQATLANSSSYTAYTPGVYTLTVEDLNNGCMSNTTIVVQDDGSIPQIVGNTALCLNPPNASVAIAASVPGVPASALSYSWLVPQGASVSGMNTGTLVTNSIGIYTLTVTSNSNNCSSSAEFTVAVCTGLANNTLLVNDLNIFPNPNNGVFTINANGTVKTLTVRVFNALGVLVKSQEINHGTDNTIDLQKEENGIYMIQVLENNQPSRNLKIIKQ